MDRFVVGTGRCGSTLLSQMLHQSPEVASLFEFMNGLDMTRRFSAEPAAGAELAKLVAQPHPFVTMVLSRGYAVPEIVYPFGPGARFTRRDGVPWILLCTLPRLSDAPDALFDATLEFCAGLPPRPLAQQYRALFDWWTQRAGKRLWIERSGSSIDYVDQLNVLFPKARFLHIHRDGREAALSMREHHAFRLAITLSTRALDRKQRTHSELSKLETGGAGEDDEISRLLKERPDAGHFGRFWTRQLLRGYRALRGLDADQWAEVRFEDLLARPREELRRICDWFELDPEAGGWIERAAGLVHGSPRPRAGELPADERARLEDACAPGMELLGRL